MYTWDDNCEVVKLLTPITVNSGFHHLDISQPMQTSTPLAPPTFSRSEPLPTPRDESRTYYDRTYHTPFVNLTTIRRHRNLEPFRAPHEPKGNFDVVGGALVTCDYAYEDRNPIRPSSEDSEKYGIGPFGPKHDEQNNAYLAYVKEFCLALQRLADEKNAPITASQVDLDSTLETGSLPTSPFISDSASGEQIPLQNLGLKYCIYANTVINTASRNRRYNLRNRKHPSPGSQT